MIGGDPTFAGWIITALYVATGIACFLAWRRSRTTGSTSLGCPIAREREAQGWFVLLLATIFFGFNKQLDLQTLLTRLGRILAREQGWYAWRREVQLAFMVAVAVETLILVVAASLLARRWCLSSALWLAFVGQVWLVVFYLMRGISYHHVDAWLRIRSPAAKTRDLIEATGLGVILLASISSFASPREPAPAKVTNEDSGCG
jgi:hypothetical protein